MKKIDAPIKYVYKFSFEDGKEKQFEIHLDPVNFNYIPGKQIEKKPAWAKLDSYRCENCPLDTETNEYCPTALNLVELMDTFQNLISYKKVNVTVETAQRTFMKKTTLQDSISSLLGIYMVTSGCPVLNKLKPMVRFHLPFATPEETIFRSTSIYLLGQYLLNHRGKKADWDLQGLINFYNQIRLVNKGMVERLRAISRDDAVANALIKLDVFTQIMPFSIQKHLGRIEYLFSEYFQPAP